MSIHSLDASKIFSNMKHVAIASLIIMLFIFIMGTDSDSSGASTGADSKRTESNSKSVLPIEHVIVVIQDGRSFDHYFGTYPGVNGITNQTAIPENPFNKEDGRLIKPFHLESTRTLSPLRTAIFNRLAYNNGSMGGFAYAQNLYGYNGSMTMGYYNYQDIPYYWSLASQYVLADNFFSPTMATGLTNYLYFYAWDQPIGSATSILPKQGLDVDTVFDQLQKHHIDWRVYMRNYDPSLNYTNPLVRTKDVPDTQVVRNPLLAIPRFVNNETLNSKIQDLSEYFSELRNNSDDFPHVAYILAPGFNEMAPSDLKSGQEFVTSLILALMQSKYWQDSVLILTYANSGGWYDHVRPPYREEGQRQNGFRVPALIISPYAKRGYVDSTLYDSGSILRFIEYLFNIPSHPSHITANNMLNAFDFESSPREPFIPPMSYTQQSAMKSVSRQAVDTSGVQMIYGTILAILLAAGIVLFLNYRTTAPLSHWWHTRKGGGGGGGQSEWRRGL